MWGFEIQANYKDGLVKTIKSKATYPTYKEAKQVGEGTGAKLLNVVDYSVKVVQR